MQLFDFQGLNFVLGFYGDLDIVDLLTVVCGELMGFLLNLNDRVLDSQVLGGKVIDLHGESGFQFGEVSLHISDAFPFVIVAVTENLNRIMQLSHPRVQL